MTTYKGDPKLMQARFNGTCAVCGRVIIKGRDIIYWPRTKKAGHYQCYEAEYNAFLASAQDEEQYQSLYR